jgi:hypothetical protein
MTLFSSFMSQLLSMIMRTLRPCISREPVKGFCAQLQMPWRLTPSPRASKRTFSKVPSPLMLTLGAR